MVIVSSAKKCISNREIDILTTLFTDFGCNGNQLGTGNREPGTGNREPGTGTKSVFSTYKFWFPVSGSI
jgi:hypothetical protein